MTQQPTSIWLVILEEGEYSDYFLEIDSAWLDENAAQKRANEIIELIDTRREASNRWEEERHALWMRMEPGPRPYYSFFNKEKEREWHANEPEPPTGPTWDAVKVVPVPIGVPGKHWRGSAHWQDRQ